MSNKIYGDNLTGYLVEGAKSKGYLKSSGKGYGDGESSKPVSNYSSKESVPALANSDNWFEGKKSSVGTTVKR